MSQYTNVRYSITLNDAQLNYLSDEQQDILRMKCLNTFIRMAVLEETKVSGKNYSAVLQPRAICGLQGRTCPTVGLRPEDGNPHRSGVQPTWHPPVQINQPNHHPHADLSVGLVHQAGDDTEWFLR